MLPRMLATKPPAKPFTRVITSTPRAMAPASRKLRFFCRFRLRAAMRSTVTTPFPYSGCMARTGCTRSATITG